jgi:ketosteroid isomerase-like protein
MLRAIPWFLFVLAGTAAATGATPASLPQAAGGGQEASPADAGVAHSRAAEDEAEIRRLHASLDRALVAGDADAFDRVFADEYFFSHHFGYKVSRADNLAYLGKPAHQRGFDILESSSADVQVRVHGDFAYLTAGWRAVVRRAGDPGALPHADRGRYTGIYARRDGGWQLVTDHLSEAMHEPRQMEREAQAASRRYVQLLKDLHSGRSHAELTEAGLIARLEQTLSADFTYTDPRGRRHTRAEELAAYRDLQTTIDTTEVIDQHVRALGNSHALESVTVRFAGTHEGKPYTVTKRSTLVWAWRDLRWQLASDHSVFVEEDQSS